MSDIDPLSCFIDSCWSKVYAEVQGAAVYIDHATSECLHWHTAGRGFLKMKDAGAVAVHELDMYYFYYAKVKDTRKAVLIATSSDPAFYQRTIKMIAGKNKFDTCTIMCSVQSRSSDHGPASVNKVLDYEKLKKDVKEWMKSGTLQQEPMVNVIYVPLFLALLHEDLVVTPPFSKLMPPLDGDAPEESLGQAINLAYSLHDLFEHINAKKDVYAVGKFSEYIAEKLESLTNNNDVSGRGAIEVPETRASVILIDRTLDLCTPTGNNTESLLGKILCTLPHLPHHENDVAIEMSRFFGQSEEISSGQGIPGCLAGVDYDTMKMIIFQKPRTVLASIYQTLNDLLATKESPKPRAATRITAHSIEKLLDKLAITDDFTTKSLYFEKLQAILAVVSACTSDKTSQLELLTSLEKLALQNLSVSRGSSSILAQLGNIIRTRASRNLDTENLLALLVHVYDLAGTQIRFSSEQENLLEEAIVDAILEDIQALKERPTDSTISSYQRTLLNTECIYYDGITRDTSKKIAEPIMCALRAVSLQRSSLQDYRSLITKPNPQEMARHIGIIEQVITDILSSDERGELRDLRPIQKYTRHSILRGRPKKRQPRDNPWIFIYVVGGITADEVRMCREVALTYESDYRLTIAGSKLLNAMDITETVLLSRINC